MSHFSEIIESAADPVFGLFTDFQQDTREKKTNLVLGVYKNEQLITPILNSVKAAEEKYLSTIRSYEYLPIDGNRAFLDSIGRLLFGENLWEKEEKRIYRAQALGGTGALRLASDFLKQFVSSKVALSDPSWANHLGVFKASGHSICTYPYYDAKNNTMPFSRVLETLEALSEKTVVLLHAVCHNPTGIDFSKKERKMLSDLILRKKLLPLFDCAYQGFGDGLEEDADFVRSFVEDGHECLIAYSCSKNFGLYAERVGALFVVCPSIKSSNAVKSQMTKLIRTNYSNPPIHGSRIIEIILSDLSLKKQWEEEVGHMRGRLTKMRLALSTAVSGYTFLQNRKGMFAFTGLTQTEVRRLREEEAVYMTADGRISLSGINEENLESLAKAIARIKNG